MTGPGDRDRLVIDPQPVLVNHDRGVPVLDLGRCGVEARSLGDHGALGRGPGRDLAPAWPRRPVCVRFLGAETFDEAFDAYLALDRPPQEHQRRLGVCGELPSLVRVVVGVEAESLGVVSTEEHRPSGRGAVRPDGRQHHGVGPAWLRGPGLAQPGVELHDRIGVDGRRVEIGEAIEIDRVNGDRVNGDRVNGDRVNGDRVNGDRVNGDRVNGDRVNGIVGHSRVSPAPGARGTTSAGCAPAVPALSPPRCRSRSPGRGASRTRSATR